LGFLKLFLGHISMTQVHI